MSASKSWQLGASHGVLGVAAAAGEPLAFSTIVVQYGSNVLLPSLVVVRIRMAAASTAAATAAGCGKASLSLFAKKTTTTTRGAKKEAAMHFRV